MKESAKGPILWKHSPYSGFTSSQGSQGLWKIFGIAIFFVCLYKMHFLIKISSFTCRWMRSSTLGLVMLFECWFSMKPLYNIFKTCIFWKVFVTDKIIFQNICWAWQQSLNITFTNGFDREIFWPFKSLLIFFFLL